MVIDESNDRVYVVGSAVDVGFPLFQNTGFPNHWYQDNTGYTVSQEAVFVAFDLSGVRLWATYYFSTDNDLATDVTVDNLGNIFMVGMTESNSNSTLPLYTKNAGGYYQKYALGVIDGFIVKFDIGGVVQWATIFGGDIDDRLRSVSCNSSNEIFVTGQTTSSNTTFPLYPPATGYYQGNLVGGGDCFIAGFRNTTHQIWSSYFGGDGLESANTIHHDSNDRIFIAGWTSSNTGFPLVNHPGAYNESTLYGTRDGFIAAFESNFVPRWATFFGGDGNDGINDIDIDQGTDRFVITGYTDSQTNFPLNPSGGNFYQPSYGGGVFDAFIGYFDANYDRVLVTYLGGDADDIGNSVSIGRNGNIFIVGSTNCTLLGCTNTFPLFDPGYGYYFDGSYTVPGVVTGAEMFITHLDPNTNLNWSTFYGQPETSEGLSKVDCSGRYLFMVGGANSDCNSPFYSQYVVDPGGGAYWQQYPTNFPGTTNCWPDGFILKFFTDDDPAFRMGYTLKQNSIQIAPNPSKGIFTVRNSDENNYFKKISIYDSMGKLVYSSLFDDRLNAEINISEYNKGVYYIQATFSS